MYALVAAQILASKGQNKISRTYAVTGVHHNKSPRVGGMALKKRVFALNGAPEIEESALHGRILGGLPHRSPAFWDPLDSIDSHGCEPTRCACLLQQEFHAARSCAEGP